MASLGIDLDSCARPRWSPGLGNGGLGRLAACFIDSLATIGRPGGRLRHPLRVRHLPADVRRRRQVEQPDTWLANGSPWEFPHPEIGRHGAVRRAAPSSTRTPTASPGRGGTTAGRSSASPTTTWSRATGTAASTPCGCGAPGRPRRSTCEVFNAGDYAAGGPRAGLRREHLQGAVPGGLHPAGQGAAPAAAVLLRRLLAARLPRPRAAPRLRPARPARAGDLPAQRHPPGDRDPGADADPGRRAADGVGRGVGDHPAVLRLHLPHAAAGGARGLAGRACSAGCCRGTWRSSTGSTRTSWPSCARPTRTTSCASAGCRSSQEYPERAVRMAYLATVAGSKVNGVAELHSAAAARQGAVRLLRPTGRRSSPTSPTASPRAGSSRLANPGLSGLITAAIGDGWVHDLDRLRELEPYADDAGFRRRRSPRSRRANKVRLVDAAGARGTASRSTRAPCST